MKKTAYTIIAGILGGIILGAVLGKVSLLNRKWDISMEHPEYWESRLQAELDQAKDALSGKIKAARVDTPEIEFDFGVKEKTKDTVIGMHDFPVANTGNLPLTLKEKTKTCFCTEFSIGKKTLQPGESTVVNVKWDAERGGGSFKQSVILTTNDPTRPEIFFNVKGLFSAPIVCHPNQLIFSGISNTEEQSREFHILGFGTEPDGSPSPLGIDESNVTLSDPEHFKVTLLPGSIDEMTEDEKKNPVLGKASSLIKGSLTITPGLPQGAFQEIIRFQTNRSDLPLLELMVEGQISGSVSISGTKYDRNKTGQLIIGPVSSAQGAAESFRLTFYDPAFTAEEETVQVVSVRPQWLAVSLTYPDKEMQKSMPVKWIDAKVEIPAGSPQERYSGPGLTETGEIIIRTGKGENTQDIVLPVNFTVGP